MMGITVREALSLRAFERAELIAGKAGLDRVITSVNMMEVPNIARFVKRNELLLTTAYPIRDDAEAQRTLIPTLADRGLAALAIKPVFIQPDEIPQTMISQADELAFPLIRLDKDASFNEIINPILGEILNRQATLLLEVEDVHRKLTQIMLDGGSLSEIARTVSILLKSPVSIHSPRFRLLASSHTDGGYEQDYQFHRDISGSPEILKSLVSGRKGQVTLEYHGTTLGVFVHPVIVAHENYAILVVWQPGDADRRGFVDIVEQASTVVALEIAKLRAVGEVEKRFRTSFMEDIIQGRIGSRAEAVARGEVYGWNLSPGFTPLLVEVDDFHRHYLSHNQDPHMSRSLRNLWDTVGATVMNAYRDSVVVDMSGRILILHRPTSLADRGRGDALCLARSLAAETEFLRPITISIGIGRYTEDILDLQRGFEQARQAVSVGRMVSGPGSCTHFDDLGVYRILADHKDRAELDRFCQDVLGGLLERDRKSGSDLVRTLGVVIDSGGNLRTASRELFVHYNTIRYRVSLIQEITGLDLTTPEARLNLQIALKIHNMGKKG